MVIPCHVYLLGVFPHPVSVFPAYRHSVFGYHVHHLPQFWAAFLARKPGSQHPERRAKEQRVAGFIRL